jgi:tetratricopeptide (TPR) repeat protein
MRVELNRRDEAFRHLLPVWRRLISNVDIGELSPVERFAIDAEFALVEAACQRSGGKPGLAMSIVLEIEGDPQYAALPTPAKGDWEAEKIACLYELADCEAAIERARAFLQQRHEECTSQARAKVGLSLGVSLSLIGRNTEAAAVLGEAVAKPWIAASPLFAIAVRQALGLALLHSGSVVVGLSPLRRAGRLARSFRDCTAAALFDLFAAEALNTIGQSQESAALLKTAVSRLESTGHKRWAAYGRVLQAEVLVGLGRYLEARQVLLAAIDGLQPFELQVELRGALQLLRQVERVIGQRGVAGGRRPSETS